MTYYLKFVSDDRRLTFEKAIDAGDSLEAIMLSAVIRRRQTPWIPIGVYSLWDHKHQPIRTFARIA